MFICTCTFSKTHTELRKSGNGSVPLSVKEQLHCFGFNTRPNVFQKDAGPIYSSKVVSVIVFVSHTSHKLFTNWLALVIRFVPSKVHVCTIYVFQLWILLPKESDGKCFIFVHVKEILLPSWNNSTLEKRHVLNIKDVYRNTEHQNLKAQLFKPSLLQSLCDLLN